MTPLATYRETLADRLGFKVPPYRPQHEDWKTDYDLAAPIAGMMGSMAHLMRGVESGEPPDNDAAGAIDSLRICLAAELSAAEGKPVNPADVPSDTTSIA